MRILHVVYTPRYSGAETLVSALTEAHGSMGHASRVVSLNPSDDSFLPVIRRQAEHGVDWISPSVPLGKVARLIFIKRVEAQFQPDVIFAHSVIPAAYARVAFSDRVITVLHDGSGCDYNSRYLGWPELFLQHRTAGVIAVSEIGRQRYAAQFIKPRTRHIPNGIDLGTFRVLNSERRRIRQRLGIDEDDFFALQVGRISKTKQQHLSIHALVPIIDETRAARLFVMGFVEDQDYFRYLLETIKKAGVENNVHFLGARNDVADMLCAADLFLMPSANEAHSMALMEALASGVPIIASTIPSFRFSEKYDGVSLVSPENIAQVTALVREVILQPKRYVRDLSQMNIDTTAKAYLAFADECIT